MYAAAKDSNCYVLLLIYIQIVVSKRFPINEFLNDTSNQTHLLCSGVDWYHRACDCDDKCFITHTCCIDKLWNVTDSLLPLDDYISNFLKHSNYVKKHACEPLLRVNQRNGHSIDTIMLINQCERNASLEDKARFTWSLTQGFQFNIPVFGSDQLLYRNAACAHCNGIKHFENLNLNIECEGRRPPNGNTTNTTTISASGDVFDEFVFCSIKLSSDNREIFNLIRNCTSSCDAYDECIITSPYSSMCEAYSGKMFGYKNYHCYLCNYQVDIFDDTCNQIIEKDELPRVTKGSWSFTISSQATVNAEYIPHDASSQNVEYYCDMGLLYDPGTKQCEQISCPPGRVLQGLDCVEERIPEIFLDHQIKITRDNQMFAKCLAARKPHMFVVVKPNSNLLKYYYQFKLINPSIMGSSFQLLYYEHVLDLSQISNISQELPYLYENGAEEVLIAAYENPKSAGDFQPWRIIHGKICAKYEVYEEWEGEFTKTCAFEIGSPKTIVNMSNYSPYIVASRELVSVCTKFHLDKNCLMQKIYSNYTINSDGTLSVQFDEKLLNFSLEEYTPLRDGVGICQLYANFSRFHPPSWKEYPWKLTLNNIEYHISVIGTVASLICYIIIIVTYLHFKVLQNISSFNVIALCVSLLLADALFILFTQINGNTTFCRYVGILLHFSLLVAQMWIVLISLDLVSKFGSVRVPSKSMKKFYIYSVVSLSLPVLIIVLSVILDETGALYFGYGEFGFCWIVGRVARIVTYLVPVVISFGIAIASLSYSIFHVNQTVKSNNKALNNSNVAVYTVAIKLVLILGVSEILGFVQISNNSLSENEVIFNSVFGFIYTCFRSLRGVLLCFIYICNKKVFKLYKTLFSGLPARHTQSFNLTSLES